MLLQAEIDDVLEYLKSVFPKWTPAPAELAIWMNRLKTCNCGPDVKAAVDGHYASGGLRPKLGELLAYLPPSREQLEAKQVHVTDYYVECVEPPALYPGRQGWRVPVIFGTRRDTPGEYHVHKAAEKIAQHHADIYGGQWQAMQLQPATAEEVPF